MCHVRVTVDHGNYRNRGADGRTLHGSLDKANDIIENGDEWSSILLGPRSTGEKEVALYALENTTVYSGFTSLHFTSLTIQSYKFKVTTLRSIQSSQSSGLLHKACEHDLFCAEPS